MTDNQPRLVQVETASDRIAILAEFPHTSPEKLFEFWTKPELLKKWWPPVVELQAGSGGAYHFSWPSQNWHLRGRFTDFEKGKSLALSWKWDHESFEPTVVRLKFEPTGNGGTKLTLHHGDYASSAEGKKTRDEHVEGWMHFLHRLQTQTG